MDSDQDMSGNDKEILQNEVMHSIGEEPVPTGEMDETPAVKGDGGQADSLSVQKRLKAQKRAHEREIRELHARMAEMQSQMQQNASNAQPDNSPYTDNGGVDDAIRKAVGFALQHKEMEERKAKEMKANHHIAKQYQQLEKHLDSTADKYDDFDDIVRGEEAPFTAHMRDVALMLPKKGPGSAGEVLYRLGKNPDELFRIAQLHPVDQAAELVALSHALISGGEQQSQAPRPLGQVKANPVVNSAGITEKTPVSSIRDRMKAGKFK